MQNTIGGIGPLEGSLRAVCNAGDLVMKKLMLVLDHVLHKQYRERSEVFGPGAKTNAIENDGDLRTLSLVMDMLMLVLDHVLHKQYREQSWPWCKSKSNRE